MHRVANHLIQLQELTLIRDEQKVAAGPPAHLEQLDSSIGAMTNKLPSDTKTQYLTLYKRDHTVITPVSEGSCSFCGMKLPISLVQAVRMEKQILCCPNCARMLYSPESPPRRTAPRPRRTAPRKVGISRFSSNTIMIPKLESTNRDGVITELATKMEEEGFVSKADKLIESSLRREAIVSTAVAHGVAFPHVRGVEGGGLSLALGISKKGIKFGGPDQKLTKIIFFLVIPTAAAAFYLKLLAGLAETFSKTDNRKIIMACKTPEELWKALVKTTRSAIK
ncbi:MAG: PTS sugar transporter subunit IIA [Kiritimatiellae bacterium]|nr:PTS sugar transporter subunit IIA [Kiritimatiellia bacterium]